MERDARAEAVPCDQPQLGRFDRRGAKVVRQIHAFAVARTRAAAHPVPTRKLQTHYAGNRCDELPWTTDALKIVAL